MAVLIAVEVGGAGTRFGRPKQVRCLRRANMAHVSQTAFELLASGKLLNRETFLVKSGMTLVQLDRAIADGRLFAVEAGDVHAYPAFYLDTTLSRQEIEAVAQQLADFPGGAKWLFFTTPKGSLAKASDGVPRTPLEALGAGKFERVMQTARGFAEQG